MCVVVDGVYCVLCSVLSRHDSAPGRKFIVVSEGAAGEACHVLLIVEQSTKCIVAGMVWWTRPEPESFTGVTFEEDSVHALM